MQTASPSTIALLLLAPFLAWRVYARFRKTVRRQRLSPWRPWMTLVAFSAIVLVLGYAAVGHIERLLSLAGGVTIGSLLGIYGLRRTRFESTPQGRFYTPHAHIGIVLSLLFAGRILYRLVQRYSLDASPAPAAPEFAQSPLTLALFGLMAGYYVAYAVGLVRWRKRVGATETEHVSGTPRP